MNFLAHLLLADDTPASIVGNLGADFMRGAALNDLDPAVQEGIRRHHRIDRFTDAHPVMARSVDRIRPHYGVYSGIVMDVFYDHFLSNRWREYSAEPLPDFIQRMYGVLEQNILLCPPSLQRVVPRLRQENWLLSYGAVEGIALTLERVSRRLTRKVHLERSARELMQYHTELDADFQEFFPELVRFVRE